MLAYDRFDEELRALHDITSDADLDIVHADGMITTIHRLWKGICKGFAVNTFILLDVHTLKSLTNLNYYF